MIKRINEIATLCDYILPGVGEGAILTGSRELAAIADFYLDQGATGVIIKNGPAGAYAKWRDVAGTHEVNVAGFRLEQVVDTVGAGDGFAVGVVTGLMEDLAMADILERANAIGAMQVSHISDNENLPTPNRLADFIATHKEERHE